MRHHCHARGCSVSCPPRYLMCKHHWSMVPRELKDGVWSAYVHGQEVAKTPTREWLQAAHAAIEHVALVEARAKGRETEEVRVEGWTACPPCSTTGLQLATTQGRTTLGYTKVERCSSCNGAGWLKSAKRTPPGVMVDGFVEGTQCPPRGKPRSRPVWA